MPVELLMLLVIQRMSDCRVGLLYIYWVRPCEKSEIQAPAEGRTPDAIIALTFTADE